MNNKKKTSTSPTDSSESLNEMTNVSNYVDAILNGARAAAGNMMQFPQSDPGENQVKQKYRKSIVRRAVHPSMVCSTPHPCGKTESNTSLLSDISTISEIGNENEPDGKNKISIIAEVHECEENENQKKGNVSKDKNSKMIDHSFDHGRNKSIGNNSKNSSKGINNMKDLSLRSTENICKNLMLPSPKQDQCIKDSNTKNIKTNKDNSKIFEKPIVFKENVNRSDIKERSHADMTKVNKDNSHTKKNGIPPKEDSNNSNSTLISDQNVQSKIVFQHSTTDEEHQILESIQQEKNIYSEEHNNTLASRNHEMQAPIIEHKNTPSSRNHEKQLPIIELGKVTDHSDVEGYSQEVEQILRTRPILEKKKNTESHHSRDSERNIEILSDIGQSSGVIDNYKMEILPNHKRKISKTRPKEDQHDDENYEISSPKRNRIIEKDRKRNISRSRPGVVEYIRSSTDSEDSESNVEFEIKRKKPRKSKFSQRKIYNSGTEERELNTRNKMKGRKTLREKSIKRKDRFSDKEIEKHETRPKLVIQKPGRSKNFKIREYSSCEEDRELNTGHKKRDMQLINKLQKSKVLKRKEYSFNVDDIQSNEEHIIIEKKVVQKPERLKINNIKGRKTLLNPVRLKTSKRKIYCTSEDDTEFIEQDANETKLQKRTRSKSLKRIVYYSPSDSELNEDHKSKTRKTLQMRGRSKSLKRMRYSSPEHNSDLSEEHKQKGKKILLKRQKSKSLKRKEYYIPQKLLTDSEELSNNSDIYEDVIKRKPIRKVVYVSEDDSLLSNWRMKKPKINTGRSISQKKYKYVEVNDEIEQNSRKRLKDQNFDINRYSVVKKPVIEITPYESDIDEGIRKLRSKRGPSQYKPINLQRMKQSVPKHYVATSDSSASFPINDLKPSREYGRLSRRDSYILEQKTKKNLKSVHKKNEEDLVQLGRNLMDENFRTPVNPKILHPQQGMATIIRGIVDEHLAKINEAKGQLVNNQNTKDIDITCDRINRDSVQNDDVSGIQDKDKEMSMTDLNMKETNTTVDKIQGDLVRNYEINDIQNGGEDNKNEMSEKDYHNELTKQNFDLISNGEPNNISSGPEDLECGTEVNTSITSDLIHHSVSDDSMKSIWELISNMNVVKHGNSSDFEKKGGDTGRLRKLARQPFMNFNRISTLEHEKSFASDRKGLDDIINYLTRKVQANRSITSTQKDINTNIHSTAIEKLSIDLVSQEENNEMPTDQDFSFKKPKKVAKNAKKLRRIVSSTKKDIASEENLKVSDSEVPDTTNSTIQNLESEPCNLSQRRKSTVKTSTNVHIDSEETDFPSVRRSRRDKIFAESNWWNPIVTSTKKITGLYTRSGETSSASTISTKPKRKVKKVKKSSSKSKKEKSKTNEPQINGEESEMNGDINDTSTVPTDTHTSIISDNDVRSAVMIQSEQGTPSKNDERPEIRDVTTLDTIEKNLNDCPTSLSTRSRNSSSTSKKPKRIINKSTRSFNKTVKKSSSKPKKEKSQTNEPQMSGAESEMNDINDTSTVHTDIHTSIISDNDVRSAVMIQSEQGTASKNDERPEIRDVTTVGTIEKNWKDFDTMMKELGKHDNEVCLLGDSFGYIAIAPGKRRHSVNMEYTVVYYTVEGTASIIMEEVLYKNVAQNFLIPKGVPVEIINTGDGRALFYVFLKE